MSPLPPDDLNRITDYIAGELPPNEAEVTEAWIAEDEERKRLVAYLRAPSKPTIRAPRAYAGVEAALTVIAARTGARMQPDAAASMSQLRHSGSVDVQRSVDRSTLQRDVFSHQPPLHRVGITRSATPWNARAAGLTALIAIGAGVFAMRTHKGNRVLPLTTCVTRVAQRAECQLSDGTQVTLAPQTTLTMRGSVVTLVGEALFTVPHRTRSPWVIRTGQVTTRVLGTVFSVRRYPEDTMTRVIVAQGRVATGATRMVTLAAHTLAYVGDSAVNVTPVDDVTDLTAWRDGRLVFNDVPVRTVLAEVGRWYGVTFRLTDETLAMHHLTTTFDIRRSRANTLAVLALALEVRMAATGDTITLFPDTLSHGAPVRNAVPQSFTPLMEIGR